ncbi:MAG: ImmA/IrrE family metallo-endopeptidase [Oscillospiraceae bacterium]|nr:ImmA/IrrE family metallo-endopeptidase [Oscillospiraceae bacterium]
MKLKYNQKSNGMYLLNRRNFDEIAINLLQTYMPEVLGLPRSVNIKRLAEDCLFLTIKDQMLSTNDSILGMTTFADVEVPCYDDCFTPTKLSVREGTILIHSGLLWDGNNTRRRYTIAHECAHWILHRSYHSPNNRQYSFRAPPVIACRKENIERSKFGFQSDNDWIEWQADGLAAAILMPQNTFWQKSKSLLRGYGKQFLIAGQQSYAGFEIIEKLSETFEVSKQAAQIRLQQLGLIRDEKYSNY